jgi:A/G-specific adenine glycosylase
VKKAQGKALPQRRRGAEKGDAEKIVIPATGFLCVSSAPLRLCGEDFSARLIRWHKRHGRHDLPWQNTADPYRVWLSEIMLQQTQVATVIPYYQRFLQRFPLLADLAAAPVEDVMALWSGLGYYARARNLHAAARAVMDTHAGTFPHDAEVIARLPGIGRSTANSIATFCFDAHAPILDGNVKRVLCRAFGIEGFAGSGVVEKRLWMMATELLPARHGAIYNQAQMDLGATVCTRSKPRCTACPLDDICVARATGRTKDLPQPKPRRAIPLRHATLLVLQDDNRVLLESRPPAGIWGGLLSLPELPEGADAREWVERSFSCRVRAVSPAPTFVHVFSHFKLHITPLGMQVEPSLRAMEGNQQWLALDALVAAALPAPVRRILEQVASAERVGQDEGQNREGGEQH